MNIVYPGIHFFKALMPAAFDMAIVAVEGELFDSPVFCHVIACAILFIQFTGCSHRLVVAETEEIDSLPPRFLAIWDERFYPSGDE